MDYGFKTTDGERLIWWRTGTDEDHWNERFAHTVEMVPRVARFSVDTRMVRLIQAVMPRTGRVLEAGCGSGWLVKLLRDAGYEAEGVDYSRELVSSVNAAYPDLPIRFADVTHMDDPDDTYSGYISLGVIEHRREGPEPFLKEAARIVRPGGMFFIAVPYFNALRRLKYGARRDDDGQDKAPFYQYGFSQSFFRKAIADAGLELLRFETYGVRRGLEEEIPALRPLLPTRIGLWLEQLDHAGFTPPAHMIAAIARKPERTRP